MARSDGQAQSLEAEILDKHPPPDLKTPGMLDILSDAELDALDRAVNAVGKLRPLDLATADAATRALRRACDYAVECWRAAFDERVG